MATQDLKIIYSGILPTATGKIYTVPECSSVRIIRIAVANHDYGKSTQVVLYAPDADTTFTEFTEGLNSGKATLQAGGQYEWRASDQHNVPLVLNAGQYISAWSRITNVTIEIEGYIDTDLTAKSSEPVDVDDTGKLAVRNEEMQQTFVSILVELRRVSKGIEMLGGFDIPREDN